MLCIFPYRSCPNGASHGLPLLVLEDLLPLVNILLVSFTKMLLLLVGVVLYLLEQLFFLLAMLNRIEECVDWPHRQREEQDAEQVLRIVPYVFEMLEEVVFLAQVYEVEGCEEGYARC